MAHIDLQSKPGEAVARLFHAKPVTDPETKPAWPPLEAALLGDTHAAVPGFPLEALPAPWRTWIGDTATSVNVPVDYVAQAVLAAVAGVCGAGVWVGVSPVWSSPLSLWLAVVGAPSSGKSPALASVRRLLRVLEGADDPDARIVAGGSLEAVLDAAHTNQRGVILWRDEPEGCFAPLPGGGGVRELDPYPVTILGALEPDRLPSTLQRTLQRGWQMSDPSAALGDLGRDAIERAIGLWSGYYRAHAKAFFDRTAPADLEARARRVVRWLQSCGFDVVSREDVRRTALGQTVNASEADRILARLTEAGVLRPIAPKSGPKGGRMALRWEVNPALREP